MATFLLAASLVTLHEGYTVTELPDGRKVCARHDEQEGQAGIAKSLGYESVELMNRDHDVVHSLLADFCGLLFYSPSLAMAADGAEPNEISGREEAAVLALQAFMLACGVDVIELAERRSRI